MENTATADSDFINEFATFNFTPSEPREKPLTLRINDDSFVEAPEKFQVILQSLDAQVEIVSPESTTVTITDNDGNSTADYVTS